MASFGFFFLIIQPIRRVKRLQRPHLPSLPTKGKIELRWGLANLLARSTLPYLVYLLQWVLLPLYYFRDQIQDFSFVVIEIFARGRRGGGNDLGMRGLTETVPSHPKEGRKVFTLLFFWNVFTLPFFVPSSAVAICHRSIPLSLPVSCVLPLWGI